MNNDSFSGSFMDICDGRYVAGTLQPMPNFSAPCVSCIVDRPGLTHGRKTRPANSFPVLYKR
jgi:hypothetical protein